MTLLFIFDMDHVLYDYSWNRRIAGLSAHTGLPEELVRQRWWGAGLEHRAEAGVYRTGDDYIAAFAQAIGSPIDRDAWVSIRGSAMTPWPESIAAVARAAELGQITLLTNNGALVGESFAHLAPDLVGLFGDHLLTSSAYGARKPEPVVFQRVLERYGVPAEDAFFADDLEENVAGAASVGITGHLFTSPTGLRAAIEDFAAARTAARAAEPSGHNGQPRSDGA
jgi:putative hydrolase of the HAD superfamily